MTVWWFSKTEMFEIFDSKAHIYSNTQSFVGFSVIPKYVTLNDL